VSFRPTQDGPRTVARPDVGTRSLWHASLNSARPMASLADGSHNGAIGPASSFAPRCPWASLAASPPDLPKTPFMAAAGTSSGPQNECHRVSLRQHLACTGAIWPRRVLLMSRSETERPGRAPGTPAWNAGRKLPAEPLSKSEANDLMRACSSRSVTGIRNRALIMIMYRGGLRVAEALALKAADIDIEQGSVRVLHGKGDKARTAGLDAGAVAVVQRWIDARKAAGIRSSAPLFCTLRGTPVSPQYVGQMLRRAARKAEIDKRVHAHGMRHTHASELVREGVPLDVIRDQLGHSSLAVTDRYLRKVAPQRVIRVISSRPAWTDDTRGE
jgi:site-specific recombinase XerC